MSTEQKTQRNMAQYCCGTSPANNCLAGPWSSGIQIRSRVLCKFETKLAVRIRNV